MASEKIGKNVCLRLFVSFSMVHSVMMKVQALAGYVSIQWRCSARYSAGCGTRECVASLRRVRRATRRTAARPVKSWTDGEWSEEGRECELQSALRIT